MRLLFILLCLSLATPVQAHTLEEIKAALRVEPSAELADLTRQLNAMPTDQPGRSHLHLRQHTYLVAEQERHMEKVCMKFHAERSALDRRLQNGKTEGTITPENLEKGYKVLDNMSAFLAVNCNFTKLGK